MNSGASKTASATDKDSKKANQSSAHPKEIAESETKPTNVATVLTVKQRSEKQVLMELKESYYREVELRNQQKTRQKVNSQHITVVPHDHETASLQPTDLSKIFRKVSQKLHYSSPPGRLSFESYFQNPNSTTMPCFQQKVMDYVSYHSDQIPSNNQSFYKHLYQRYSFQKEQVVQRRSSSNEKLISVNAFDPMPYDFIIFQELVKFSINVFFREHDVGFFNFVESHHAKLDKLIASLLTPDRRLNLRETIGFLEQSTLETKKNTITFSKTTHSNRTSVVQMKNNTGMLKSSNKSVKKSEQKSEIGGANIEFYTSVEPMKNPVKHEFKMGNYTRISLSKPTIQVPQQMKPAESQPLLEVRKGQKIELVKLRVSTISNDLLIAKKENQARKSVFEKHQTSQKISELMAKTLHVRYVTDQKIPGME